MNSGDIVPDMLRAAPVVLLLWCLLVSIRAWRRPTEGKSEQQP